LLPIQTADVIEQDEKGSDVNLASYLLVGAHVQEYDLAIIVSNDSDLATPITLVRSVFGRQVALLNPRPKTATDLQNIADIYRTVRRGPLHASQLPPVLADANGTIHKPQTGEVVSGRHNLTESRRVPESVPAIAREPHLPPPPPGPASAHPYDAQTAGSRSACRSAGHAGRAL
jgi:hypothetical protein